MIVCPVRHQREIVRGLEKLLLHLAILRAFQQLVKHVSCQQLLFNLILEMMPLHLAWKSWYFISLSGVHVSS